MDSFLLYKERYCMGNQDYSVFMDCAAKTMFEQIGLTEADVAAMSNYSIKKVYGLCRGEFQKIPWRRLICNNAGLPKWLFILLLALQRRLQIKERIACWANIKDMECVLCSKENEDIDHILFEREYAKQVWSKLLFWQGIHRDVSNWQHKVTWAMENAKGKNAEQELYRMTLAGGVYHLW
ncbi:uncharacterized protein [Nicotiana tomentosiformis]|uniref:uncharacterized protein n=1 Tax=Nicotiana tomentosiformis TaxID=4098 RepID=UPI00388C99CA